MRQDEFLSDGKSFELLCALPMGIVIFDVVRLHEWMEWMSDRSHGLRAILKFLILDEGFDFFFFWMKE